MNKKRLSALIALILCVSMTAGCSGGADGASGKQSGGSTGQTASESKVEYTLKDAVIADNDYYTITANTVETGEDMDCIVNFTIENKTVVDLAFDFGDIYMNGYSAWGEWPEESEKLAYAEPESTRGMMPEPAGDSGVLGLGVPAGGSTSESFTCTMYEHNMPVIDEILLTVRVYFQHEKDDPSSMHPVDEVPALTYEQANALTEQIEYGVYPTGLTADTVEYPEHQAVDGEQVIVDNDEFTYIIQELREENDGDTFRIWIYTENKTDKTLNFSWPESQVNGVSADLNRYGTDVAPGKRDYSAELIMKDYDEFFPEDGNVETITFNLLVEEERSLTDLSFTDTENDTEPVYEGTFTCSFDK